MDDRRKLARPNYRDGEAESSQKAASKALRVSRFALGFANFSDDEEDGVAGNGYDGVGDDEEEDWDENSVYADSGEDDDDDDDEDKDGEINVEEEQRGFQTHDPTQG